MHNGGVSATHIAVVDDEIDITQLIARYLGAMGFRVTQLHRGADLLALMQGDPPALVLLDLGLPDEDGFAIARQLREHHHCGLVIVSGRGDAVDKVVGLEVGADDYVTKPFDLRELLARVKAVLRRAGIERAAARMLMSAPQRSSKCLSSTVTAASASTMNSRKRAAAELIGRSLTLTTP